MNKIEKKKNEYIQMDGIHHTISCVSRKFDTFVIYGKSKLSDISKA